MSGCHSKFFSNALDPSLVSTSQLSNGSHPHPSPFHHPTPDLRQLARSVHLANAQAERNAIPQSPTLAKLLAAKADTNRIDEENADDLGENDDVGWLMPAPAPAALAANKAKGAVQQLSLKNVLKRTSSSNSAFSTANLHHHTRIVEFGKVKEVKEKRDEINARKMKQSNGLKPFSSSLALVNAHAASAAQTAGSTNGGSAMANSIGARNMVTSMPTASKNEEARLSTTTLSQISGRISKRKAASPKKMVQPEKGSKGRTLVLATPVKLKSKTSSSQSLWNSRPPMIQGNGNGNLQERARLGKSKSLPAFVWGNPAAGRGIDEVDEEDLDRGFGLGDEEQDMEGDREEDQISRHTHVLAGETPRK